MLDITKLAKAAALLSIHRLCKEAGVSYYTVHQKIYRHKSKPTQGRLNSEEISKIIVILKKHGIYIVNS